VGPPAAVLAALNRLPTVHVKAQTDLSRLLEIAAELLDKAPPLETKRRRAILLLSLGEPSAPHGVYWSSREAVNYAHELGRRGISIWAVPFALANVEYLNELTRSTGGRVVDLEELNAFFGVPLVMTPATGTTSSTGQP
jgi:Mg-chelatase subunit ChlD